MVASDLMSSPIVASATEPVSEVARRMLETGVNGMPVVDAAGVPVGMVSDGDLVGAAATGATTGGWKCWPSALPRALGFRCRSWTGRSTRS